MNRTAIRTVVIPGVGAGLVVISAVAVSAIAATATNPEQPRLPARTVLQIAHRASAAAGEPRPTLIQHSQGTRYRANLVAGGDRVPGRQWSYLIAIRGSFILRDVSVPAGAHPPRGSVLTLVVDAAT